MLEQRELGRACFAQDLKGVIFGRVRRYAPASSEATSRGQNLTTEVKESDKQPRQRIRESNWSKVGVIAGVVGALATVAVFGWPTRDGRDETARARQSPAATASQYPTSASPNPSGTSALSERHLAELPFAQGGGAVTVVNGRDLSMPCGSGQSDDRYRQIEYELPGPYTSFTTSVTARGKADVEAQVGVQVFVRARQDRSDRTPEVGRTVLHPNGSEPLTADITDARAILLRITCSTSALTVTFTDPRIGH
jgi:hypothetical protein